MTIEVLFYPFFVMGLLGVPQNVLHNRGQDCLIFFGINPILPIRKTAAPMKTARKTRSDSFAMYSMKNANDPASSVPNPLLSPLHKVAPICQENNKTVLRLWFS